MARITCNWCRYLTSSPSPPVTITLSLKCVIILVLLLVIYTAAVIMFLELRHSASYVSQQFIRRHPLPPLSYPLSKEEGVSGNRIGGGATGGNHYGIVIDCGSSGSRVYVYQWPTHSGNPKELLQIEQLMDARGRPIVKKITPGLSTFGDNPSSSSTYIRPLLTYAAQHIPEEKHSETLLYILATAGMRVLPESTQRRILDELQTSIPKDFKFVVADNHFEVITGKQEGVYGWISVNYILNKFAHGIEVNCGKRGGSILTEEVFDGRVISFAPVSSFTTKNNHSATTITRSLVHNGTGSLNGSNSTSSTEHPQVIVDVPGQSSISVPHSRRRTVGVIDMGGGSMQIAFEVTKKIKFDYAMESPAQNLMAEFNLGCKSTDLDHNYQLYVSTFLGYGANSARERYEEMLLQLSANSSQGYHKLNPIPDPCLPLGLHHKSADRVHHETYFVGLGDYNKCKMNLLPLLNLTVPCQKHPCSMNGIYQANINFNNSEFYGFSEFWYSMEDVYRVGGHYDSIKFDKMSNDHCATRWAKLEEWFNKRYYPKSDAHRLRLQCFKAAWMSVVLHHGFKFPRNYRHFYSTQKIDGKDVQWTLGALIHRSRYLPLREIDQSYDSNSLHSSLWASKHTHHFYYEYLILLCFLVVVMAIILYVRRLRLIPSSSSSSTSPLSSSSPSSSPLISPSSPTLVSSASSPLLLSSSVGGSTTLNRVPSASYFMSEDSSFSIGGKSMSSKMMDSAGGLYFKNSAYS